MQCPACRSRAKKSGHDRRGSQRYKCLSCGKRFADQPARPLGEMRLPLDRALLVLHLLTEGASVRAIERITGTEKRTILRLLVQVG